MIHILFSKELVFLILGTIERSQKCYHNQQKRQKGYKQPRDTYLFFFSPCLNPIILEDEGRKCACLIYRQCTLPSKLRKGRNKITDNIPINTDAQCWGERLIFKFAYDIRVHN